LAKTKDNILTKGMKGSIGKEVVYKTTKNGTFACKYPDMSGVVQSKNQTKERSRFAGAVKYAQSAIKDPEKSARYKKGNSNSVYHAAIKDYMSLYDPEKRIIPDLPEAVQTDLLALSLSHSQMRSVKFIIQNKKLTNSIYQKMNGVSKATATRHLQELGSLNIIQFNNGKGAGAFYILGPRWKDNGLI
jgi:Fic family protein